MKSMVDAGQRNVM